MEKGNVIKMKRTNAELSRYIEFSLGLVDCAIPLLMVREVISVPETTPVTKSPAYFLGNMNLRGQVISIIDLRKKLNVAAKKNKEEAVIIVDVGGINMGVVVDSINKVLAFAADDVSENPETDLKVDAAFVFGVYKKEKSMTVLLDIAKVLDVTEMDVKKAA